MLRLSDRLRQLERGVTFKFNVSPDEDGYLDKESPNPGCLFGFKVHAEDWRSLFRDEAVFCPMCRHEAPSDKWWTTEQVKEAERRAVGVVGDAIVEHIDDVLAGMVRSVNQGASRGRGGVSMSMTFKPAHRSRRGLDPTLAAREAYTLKVACEACGARIAVVGSAFFCAACGHSGAERLFDEAIAKVRLKVEQAPRLRDLLTQQGERDAGAVLARELLEESLSDCVVALQRLAEQLYLRFRGLPAARQNAFQRLDDLDSLWRAAGGKGLSDWLDPKRQRRLRLFYQRRHLLAHTDGMVDNAYVRKSDDTAYRAGQRIVVKPAEVLEMAELVGRVAAGMRATAPTPP